MKRAKSKKDKKHSGRYTPKILKPQMKFDEIKESAFEPTTEYDDWIERRDGFRDITYLDWKKRDKAKNRKVFK